MIGLATLVPPSAVNVLWYTITTPGFGSACAETSAIVRREQPVSFCHVGFVMNALQPLPAPGHTTSVHLRALVALWSDVPPTAVTYCDAAGNWGPEPNAPSPELTVIMMPLCL